MIRRNITWTFRFIMRLFVHFIKYNIFSISRIKNIFVVFISAVLDRTSLKGIPPVLTIEPANTCNYNCPLCLTGQGLLRRKKAVMPFSHFKYIIDQIKDKVMVLMLYQMGEPFMNKDIYKMISYAKKARLFIRISTNGYFLNDEEKLKKLVEAGMDHLIIALDGLTAESYDKYRKNGDFERLLNNIRKLVKIKRDLKSELPIIDLLFCVTKNNEHEVKFLKRFKDDMGVDMISLKAIFIKEKSDISKYLPEEEQYLRYKIKDGDYKAKRMFKGLCWQLTFGSVINSEGKVIPCCDDEQSEHILGDTYNDKFEDIWKSDRYKKFRTMSYGKQIELCSNCGARFFYHLKYFG